jgi:hypothetical protein
MMRKGLIQPAPALVKRFFDFFAAGAIFLSRPWQNCYREGKGSNDKSS